jgi:xylulokinase
VDAEGAPLGPAVMYNDSRTAAYVDQAAEAIDDHSGLRIAAADPLPHALWLRTERREIFARSRYLLDATGWMNFLLSGRATINAYTALRLGREQTVLPRLGLPVGLFGEAVRIGADLGPLRPKLQARLGWSAIPIIAATFDSKCAYLAAGLDRVGLGLDISGTVTSFGAWSPRPVVDPYRRVYPVPYNDSWLMRGSTAASGSVLEWARELLAADFQTLDALVAATVPDADGPLLVPFHAGARAPLWQPQARGQILGLSLDSGRAAVARATYESLGLSLRHIVETIEGLGVEVDEIRLAGGLASNAALSQVKANIVGKPLIALKQTELTTLGLAAIAGVAIGRYADLPAAARQLVSPGRRFTPDPERTTYDTLFGRYLAAAASEPGSPSLVPGGMPTRMIRAAIH